MINYIRLSFIQFEQNFHFSLVRRREITFHIKFGYILATSFGNNFQQQLLYLLLYLSKKLLGNFYKSHYRF
jgi:hypothetical protein